MEKKIILQNCVGCGVCAGINPDQIKMIKTEDGFLRPIFNENFDLKALESVCPIFYFSSCSIGKLWGPYEGLCCAYSNDAIIRKKASSGGVITSLLIWLLDTKKVDAVVEIGADDNNPLQNRVYLCRTKEEILKCSGSRYAPASPLEKISEILSLGLSIAFVGKPCDVRAVRKLMNQSEQAKQQIRYIFSFFCAGTPSEQATVRLAQKLNANIESIKSISYRGNGWPGYATIIDLNGEHTMDYESSWSGILGRNKQQFCRYCADGTGEDADIACGDCWYLNDNRQPVFDDGEGRNVVFLRTLRGKQLFESAAQQKVVSKEPYEEEMLQYIQPYQFERKTTLLAQILALKMLGKYAPNYKWNDLIQLSRRSNVSKLMRIFLGTVKRIQEGKII